MIGKFPGTGLAPPGGMARWWTVLTALAAACLGTPQPDPPNLDPEVIELGTPQRSTAVTIVGGAGAVLPVGATLRVTNLDDLEAPVDVVSGDDGSFEVSLVVDEGDELRLQVVSSAGRSRPWDVAVQEWTLVPPLRPLEGCLTTEPEMQAEVPAGATTTIVVSNDCGETVTFSRVALRRETGSIAVGTAPAAVEAGSSAAVEVSLAGDAEGAEEVLLVEAEAPERDRRAVTIIGVAAAR